MGIYATSEKTRANLITAAGEIAAEFGLGAVSTRAIAERAQENISSIHYHFGGKEQLLEEVLKTITLRHRQTPIPALLEQHAEDMKTPAGQAKIVRALVLRFIDVIFCPENPWWYERLFYQALSLQTVYRDYLYEHVIHPDMIGLSGFIRQVKPELSEGAIVLYSKIFQAPIIIHTQNISNGFAPRDHALSPQTLAMLRETTIRQNLYLLGLPIG